MRAGFVPGQEDGLRGEAAVRVRRPSRTKIGQWLHYGVIAAALIFLLVERDILRLTSAVTLAVLTAIFILVRATPLTLIREKPVTLCASIVFASAIVVGGAAAGVAALIGGFLLAQLQRRGARFGMALEGAQFVLAALAAERIYVRFGATEALDRAVAATAAALAFIALQSGLAATIDLTRLRPSSGPVHSLLAVHAAAYLASFALVVCAVAAFPAFHLGLVASLAAALTIGALTVRTTLENRLLRRQLWSVEKLGRTCANEVRVEAPLKQFLSLAGELVSYDRAVLWLIDDQTSNLRARVSNPELAGMPLAADAGPETILGRVAERNNPLITTNTWSDPFRPSDGEGESWLLYPLTHLGRPLGVAQFVRTGRHPFTREEMTRLATLVPQATVAFESVRVRHEMFRYRDKSVTDSLTGLLNHQASKNQLYLEVERTQRYFRTLSILMLDVDTFKEFNDTYGHPQGDTLLISLARILRSSVRTIDHVGRYGGEEFIIVLPETSRSDAQILAERIRATIAAQLFTVGDGQEVRRTVSIGVAGYPEDAMDADQLIQHADDALYRAKRAGRNCVLTA
jgi:diguanylate cyclase (GGDEF)-like protein